jgi:hypothetical protein
MSGKLHGLQRLRDPRPETGAHEGRSRKPQPIDSPLQTEEGIFLTHGETPPQDSEVYMGGDKPYKVKENGYGVSNHYAYTMHDGNAHTVVHNVPHPHLRRSNVAIAGLTAWKTRPDAGFYGLVDQALLAKGHETIRIGAEGSAPSQHPSFLKKLSSLAFINLETSINNANQIVAHRLGNSDADPERLIAIGDSRGDMGGQGLGMTVYGDFIAGCFPKEVAGRLGAEKTAIKQVPNELLELLGGIATYKPHEAVELLNTVSLHPRAVLHQLMTWPTLKSGHAGKIAQRADPTVPMLLTKFDKDSASMPYDEPQHLAHRADTIVELLRGGHMTIIHKTIRQALLARLDNMVEQRGLDGSFDKVDFDVVRTAHHELLSDRLLKITRIGGQLAASSLTRAAA